MSTAPVRQHLTGLPGKSGLPGLSNAIQLQMEMGLRCLHAQALLKLPRTIADLCQEGTSARCQLMAILSLHPSPTSWTTKAILSFRWYQAVGGNQHRPWAAAAACWCSQSAILQEALPQSPCR